MAKQTKYNLNSLLQFSSFNILAIKAMKAVDCEFYAETHLKLVIECSKKKKKKHKQIINIEDLYNKVYPLSVALEVWILQGIVQAPYKLNERFLFYSNNNI